MMNRQQFFLKIKQQGLFKEISEKQLRGITAILDKYEESEINNPKQLAYILATVYHETYDFLRGVREMHPMKELGGEAYLKRKPYYPYYGRDFCHTTWLSNFEKVKAFSGVDVVKDPDKIADISLATDVLFHFMIKGLYTGKKLSDYITTTRCDYDGARRIINGTDKAKLIAGYAMKFEKAL
jgi:predicted chitinase